MKRTNECGWGRHAGIVIAMMMVAGRLAAAGSEAVRDAPRRIAAKAGAALPLSPSTVLGGVTMSGRFVIYVEMDGFGFALKSRAIDTNGNLTGVPAVLTASTKDCLSSWIYLYQKLGGTRRDDGEPFR